MWPMKTRGRRRPCADDQDELAASARDETLRVLDEEGAAAVALGGRLVLCQTPEAVEAALAGKIPPGAVRLDGGRRG